MLGPTALVGVGCWALLVSLLSGGAPQWQAHPLTRMDFNSAVDAIACTQELSLGAASECEGFYS